jgi:hypothetical protein
LPYPRFLVDAQKSNNLTTAAMSALPNEEFRPAREQLYVRAGVWRKLVSP